MKIRTSGIILLTLCILIAALPALGEDFPYGLGALPEQPCTEHVYVLHGEQLMCERCGAVSEHVHKSDHVQGFRAFDEATHVEVHICLICGKEYLRANKEPHNYNTDNMRCINCGYLADGCEHAYTEFTADTSLSTAGSHVLTRVCTKCGKNDTCTGSHEPVFVSETYEQTKEKHISSTLFRCSVCGYEYTVEGKEEDHTFGNHQKNDMKTHFVTCSVCGMRQEEAHGFVLTNINRYATCSACGERHDHSWAAGKGIYLTQTCAPVNAKEHKYVNTCSLCGKKYLENLAGHDFVNGTCTECGYEEPLSAAAPPMQTEQTVSASDLKWYRFTVNEAAAECEEITVPADENGTYDLVLIPAAADKNSVFSLTFSLQALQRRNGLRNIYVRADDADILLLEDAAGMIAIMEDLNVINMTVTAGGAADGEDPQ